MDGKSRVREAGVTGGAMERYAASTSKQQYQNNISFEHVIDGPCFYVRCLCNVWFLF